MGKILSLGVASFVMQIAATAVSVVLREDNPEVSGLTPTLLAGFDRIYADSYTVDCDALVQKLPDSFKSETQLVKMVREAQSSGSYMIVQ